jgi:hypothetical protein
VVRGRIVRVEPRSPSTDGFRVGVAFDQPVPEDCLLVQAAAVRHPLRAARGAGR